ncbi:MAG: HAMP domain-containing protein [Dethiobacter sp.]|nr:HAMP domain-containing protein [Dethiobacter sp.]
MTMKNSLSKKITMAMVTLAVSGILLTVIITNLFLSWNFNRYLRSVQEEQNRRIVETLAELYAEATSWTEVRRSTIHVGSTTSTQIRVFDNGERIIADSLPGMMQGKQGRRWQRAQIVRGQAYTYPLHVNEQRIGAVEITHLGQQGLWTGEAQVFRRTVMESALFTGLTFILAAGLVGSLLSRRLTSRFIGLTSAAEKWGHGHFNARVDVDGDDELTVLGETMNRMAHRLEEQSNLRKKLTGDISHELRTPLTTIQSYLEAFLDDVMVPDEQSVKTILEESRRLGRLVSDLQELTTVECRTKSAELSVLELNDFTLKETERIKPMLAQKGIEFQVQIKNTPVCITADEALLGRVLGNLLVNAYKYTPAGGKVTVSVFEQGTGAGVAVVDNGCGIAKEHLPHIFERFYRVDPSRTRVTGDTGIGLAIVKELAEAMGGSVDVASELYQGSTFRVILQKAPE